MLKPWQSRIQNQQRPLKFFLVGIWNSIFGYGMFYLLDTLLSQVLTVRYMAYMTALTFAQLLGIINAYIFHKHITFQSTVRGEGIFIEFARFFSTYLFSMILGLILLPVFVEAIGIAPRISAALLIPVTTIISYIGHSRFSFRM